MMAPPRKQAEQAALDRLVVGGRQDAAAERDRGVSGPNYVTRCARHGFRLRAGEAQRIGARQLAGERAFVDIGSDNRVGPDSEPSEQIASARRYGFEDETQARLSREEPRLLGTEL